MGVKTGILLITILAGCLAIPAPGNDVSEEFFIHADASARIVGGTQAAQGSAPWMVAMSNGAVIRSFVCGGSLISQRTVLTAAHCIAAVFSWGSLSSSLLVRVGTNTWNSGGQSYNIQRNVTHPNYVSATIKNDIGVLITLANVIFSAVVQPVQLSFEHVAGGVPSRANGWGRIAQGAALSQSLLELHKPVIDGEDCVRLVREAAIANNMNAPAVEPHIEICTAHPSGAGFGMCNGDSGSALVRTDRPQVLEQIALVSWGIPCARGAPDMFVRISPYQDWIIDNAV